MTLTDWFTHIQHIHHKRMDFDLERIGIVATQLSLTQFSCPVITVTGTNGKGSCVKTLESIYAQAGYKTALYTSPHLMDFNERIRIHNKNISDQDLVFAFEIIEKARNDIILSFFEFITLAALYLFQQAKCDIIILEAGLGGRLDAVNIVENDIAVVTSIALDHMEYLGNNRESIAYEKASIARFRKILVCGEENPPENIANIARDKQATLIQINRDFFYHQFGHSLEIIFHDHFSMLLPLPKNHLKSQNIAIAIQITELLKTKLPITEKNIIDGIVNTHWPGRFEYVAHPFPCILDVAHNPHAAAWLAKQYQQLPVVKNAVAVVGMLKDKAMTETVSQLLPYIKTWYVCSLTTESKERGSDGVEIAEFLKAQGVKNCYHFTSVADAMDSLLHGNCQRALIFGSFCTVATATKWVSITKMD